MEKCQDNGMLFISIDQTTINETIQISKGFSRLKTRLSNNEIVSFLQTCRKINNFKSFSNSIKNVPGLNFLIQKGVIEFSLFTQDQIAGVKFQNYKLLISIKEINESWVDFLKLIVNINNANSTKDLSFIYCLEFIESLLTLHQIMRKSYSLENDDESISIIQSCIRIFFNGDKIHIHKIITDKILLKLLIQVSEQYNSEFDIFRTWDNETIEIVENIFKGFSISEIFKTLLNNQIVKLYLESLSVVGSNINRSVFTFRALSIIIAFCERNLTHQLSSKIINEFETFNGFQICIDYLLKNEIRSDYENFFALFKLIINLLLTISFLGVSENEGYVVIFRKQTNDQIIRNLKSINIFVIFFVENDIPELSVYIIQILQILIQENSKNLEILSKKGILNVILINSVSKDEKIQTKVLELLHLIFDNFMNSDLTSEMSTLGQILAKNQCEFTKRIIKMFSLYFDNKKFINLIEANGCVEAILANLMYLFKTDSKHEIQIVIEILESIIKIFGAKRFFANGDYLTAAWDYSIDSLSNFTHVRNMAGLFLGHGSQKVIEYLLTKLKNTNIKNLAINLSIAKFLNSYYKQNRNLLELLRKNDGIQFCVEEIFILVKVSRNIDSSINECFSILEFVKNILGLVISLLNFRNRIEPFFCSRFDDEDFLNLQKAFLEFDFYKNFININQYQHARNCLSEFFEILFLASFESDSLYDEKVIYNIYDDKIISIINNDEIISNIHDKKLNIPTGIIKYPQFLSIIISYIEILSKSIDINKDENSEFSNILLKEILCGLVGVLDIRNNSQSMCIPTILDNIIPCLFSIGKNPSLEDVSKQILIRIISHSSLSLVIRNYLKLKNIQIPYFYFELFNQHKYKPLESFRTVLHIPYTEAFQYYYSQKLSPEFDSLDIYKSSSELGIVNESSSEDIFLQSEPKSTLEVIEDPKNKQIDDLIISESQDTKIDVHFLETLTEGSTQWENVKSFLLPSTKITKTHNISMDSLNITSDIDVSITEQPETNNNFPEIFSFLSNISQHLKELKLDSDNTEKLHFNVVISQNQFSYISIPEIVKNTYFYSPKSHFDLLKAKIFTKPHFSFSLWFRVNSNITQNVSINILSLVYKSIVLNRKSFSDVNFLTVVYHAYWKKLVLTTEAKNINDLDTIESITDTKHKTTFQMDAKLGRWHQIVLCIDGAKNVNGQNTITIYLDGNRYASFQQFFERLIHEEVFLEVRVGSTPQMKESNSSYQLGGIALANQIFTETEIRSLNILDLGDFKLKETANNISTKINYSLYPRESIFFQKNFLFKIDPCVNIDIKHDFPANSFSLNSKLLSSEQGNYEYRLLKNSLFSQSDCVFRSLNYPPNCSIISSSSSCFSVLSLGDLKTALFSSYGIEIFLLLIEQSKDSASMFHYLDSLINFICSNSAISIYITKDLIETLIFIIKHKSDLIDLKISLLLISFSSNGLFLSPAIIERLIYFLIMDLELWFSLSSEIVFEILKFIRNILFEPKVSPIKIDTKFIENYLLDSLSLCLLIYQLNSSCQNVINEIIEYILTTNPSEIIIKKFFLFIFDSMVWNSLPPICQNRGLSPGSAVDNFPILIMVLINRFFIENNSPFIDVLESSIGVYGFILLLEHSKSEELNRFSLSVIGELISGYKPRGPESIRGNDCLIISEFKRLSFIYSKVEKLIKIPKFNELCFYLGRVLSNSSLSFNQIALFLVQVMCNNKSLHENSLIEPDLRIFGGLIKKITSSNNKIGSVDHPSYVFPEFVILTLQYFFEVLKKPQNNYNYIVDEFFYFLQSLELFIFSSSEPNKVLLCYDFIHGCANLYSLLDLHAEWCNDKTMFMYIKETLLKIIILFYEKSIDNHACEISENWIHPESLGHYPQLMLYSLLINDVDHHRARDIISYITLKIFNTLMNVHGNLGSVKLTYNRISVISTFLTGHALCFGANFDHDLFMMIVKFTRFAFSLIEEEYQLILSEYSSCLNKYISNIMVFDKNNPEEYISKFKTFIPIFSANAHILINSSNKNTESLKNLISLLFYHCFFITKNLDILKGVFSYNKTRKC